MDGPRVLTALIVLAGLVMIGFLASDRDTTPSPAPQQPERVLSSTRDEAQKTTTRKARLSERRLREQLRDHVDHAASRSSATRAALAEIKTFELSSAGRLVARTWLRAGPTDAPLVRRICDVLRRAATPQPPPVLGIQRADVVDMRGRRLTTEACFVRTRPERAESAPSQVSPAPAPAEKELDDDARIERDLQAYIEKNFGGGYGPGSKARWYSLIEGYDVGSGDVTVQTSVFPDGDAPQIAQAICAAVIGATLPTNNPSVDGITSAVVHGTDGIIQRCQRAGQEYWG